jgi:hypothetical protein
MLGGLGCQQRVGFGLFAAGPVEECIQQNRRDRRQDNAVAENGLQHVREYPKEIGRDDRDQAEPIATATTGTLFEVRAT